MYREFEFRNAPRRSYQEFLKLASAFLIAPIPYPHDIGIFGDFHWEKMCGIGGLVESPCSPDTKALQINSADCFAKGQDSIELIQRHSQDFLRTGIGTMVSIVKQGT
jgi:hypothetical protein